MFFSTTECDFTNNLTVKRQKEVTQLKNEGILFEIGFFVANFEIETLKRNKKIRIFVETAKISSLKVYTIKYSENSD